MITKTLATAAAVAALSTSAMAGNLSDAGISDDTIIVVPEMEPAGSSAGLMGSGGAALPVLAGLALIAAVAASGGS